MCVLNFPLKLVDYDQLKEAHNRNNLSKQGYQQKFHKSRPEEDEEQCPEQYIERLKNTLKKQRSHMMAYRNSLFICV